MHGRYWTGEPKYTANEHWEMVIEKTMNTGEIWNSNCTLFDSRRQGDKNFPVTKKHARNPVFQLTLSGFRGGGMSLCDAERGGVCQNGN